MSDGGRHERAVAQSFGFAQEAAANGDFINATELRVVEVVDGGLPAEWERTREYWVDRQRSAQPHYDPTIPPLTMLERGSDRWFGEEASCLPGGLRWRSRPRWFVSSRVPPDAVRQAKTTLGENAVFVVLQDTLTRGERTLVDAGESEAVLDLRRRWQRIMRSSFTGKIERLTGRKVIGFMSDNHIDPDIAVEVFILEPVEADPAVRAAIAVADPVPE